MRKVPIGSALAFSVFFVNRNAQAIAVRILLPAITGWCLLYASAFLYLSELQRFLAAPSDRSGSLVLGLVAGGLLGVLLLHAMIISALVALALGMPTDGQPYFRAKRREWRIYAANLRLLAVAIVLIAVVGTISFVFIGPLSVAGFGFLDQILVAGGVFALSILCAFLIPPIAVAEPEGQIVRRAARLSQGNFWRIAAIMIVLIVPGCVIEMLGEYAMRIAGIFRPFPGPVSLAEIVVTYRNILPEALALVGIAYIVSVVLMAGASAFVYSQLTDRPMA